MTTAMQSNQPQDVYLTIQQDIYLSSIHHSNVLCSEKRLLLKW